MNDNSTVNKTKIFLDVDDTILRSSETVIDIINDKYNLNPGKTINDLKDWKYRSIYKDLGCEDILEIYSSNMFFDNVKPFDEFKEFYGKNADKYEFVVATKGTKENLAKKKEIISKIYGDNIDYCGIEFERDEYGCFVYNYDKSCVDMSGAIQVDDRADALANTNAAIKILLTNGHNRYWNKDVLINVQNLYIANNWEEVITIIEFFDKNREFLA